MPSPSAFPDGARGQYFREQIRDLPYQGHEGPGSRRLRALAGKAELRARGAKRTGGVAAVLAAFALIEPLTISGRAQEAVPLVEPKPVFVPGLYETESRNSRWPDQGFKAEVCLQSADFEAFRKETIDQYLKSPQFVKACRLSDTRTTVDGFAFAMDCGEARHILTYRFGKDMVQSTDRTEIVSRPEFSSDILTILHRLGECKGDMPSGRKL
jgi:hypothetical protein